MNVGEPQVIIDQSGDTWWRVAANGYQLAGTYEQALDVYYGRNVAPWALRGVERMFGIKETR